MVPSSMSSQGSARTESGSTRVPAVRRIRMQVPSYDEQKAVPLTRLRRCGRDDEDPGEYASVFQTQSLVAINDRKTDLFRLGQLTSLRKLGTQAVELAGARNPKLDAHVVLSEDIVQPVRAIVAQPCL